MDVENVEGADFWVWSGGIDPIGVGGGGGDDGGVEGIFDEANAGDAGADFGIDSADVDFRVESIGADFHTVSIDVGVNIDADSAGESGDGGIRLSDITSGIIWRGGKCTSTMLCCMLSFPCDSEVLSMEETLDLLLLLVPPL